MSRFSADKAPIRASLSDHVIPSVLCTVIVCFLSAFITTADPWLHGRYPLRSYYGRLRHPQPFSSASHFMRLCDRYLLLEGIADFPSSSARLSVFANLSDPGARCRPGLVCLTGSHHGLRTVSERRLTQRKSYRGSISSTQVSRPSAFGFYGSLCTLQSLCCRGDCNTRYIINQTPSLMAGLTPARRAQLRLAHDTDFPTHPGNENSLA